jgi:hypothetical protein
MAPAQAKGKTPRSRRRQQSIREAKEAAGAGEVAIWAALLEEEMEAGLVREPEVEYDDWGYYLRSWKTTMTTTFRLYSITSRGNSQRPPFFS